MLEVNPASLTLALSRLFLAFKRRFPTVNRLFPSVNQRVMAVSRLVLPLNQLDMVGLHILPKLLVMTSSGCRNRTASALPVNRRRV